MVRITEVLEDLDKLKVLRNDYKIINIQLLLHDLINAFDEENLNKIIQELQIYFDDKFHSTNSYVYSLMQFAYKLVKVIFFVKETKEEIELGSDKQIVLRCLNNLRQILAKSIVIRTHRFSLLDEYNLVGGKLIWLQMENLYPEVLFLPCQQGYLPYIGKGLCCSFAARAICEVLSHNTLFGRSLTDLSVLDCGTLKENNKKFFNSEVQWLQQYINYCVPMVRKADRLTTASMDEIINTFIEHSLLNTAIWIHLLDITNNYKGHVLGLIKDQQNNLILVDANSGCYIFKDAGVFRRGLVWYMEYTFYAKKFYYIGYSTVSLEHCQEIMSFCELNIKRLQCELTIQKNILGEQECKQNLLISKEHEQYSSARIAIYDKLIKINGSSIKAYRELGELRKQIIAFDDMLKKYLYTTQVNQSRNFLVRSVLALADNCIYVIYGVKYIIRNCFAAKQMSVVVPMMDYSPLIHGDIKTADGDIKTVDSTIVLQESFLPEQKEERPPTLQFRCLSSYSATECTGHPTTDRQGPCLLRYK